MIELKKQNHTYKRIIMRFEKKWIALGATFLLTQIPFSSQAWDANGHIIIAQIAYDNLTPVAQQDVNYLTQKTSFSTTFPAFSSYIYSAPWPDYLNYDVKNPTGDAKDIFKLLRGEVKSWHYTDDPIVVGDYPATPVSNNNSVWAINYLVPHLSELLQAKNYDLAAYDLVFITHIVGDIHQPLHNATLFDSDFPSGDIGGNLYKIKSSFGATELHAAWDDSLGQFKSWANSGKPDVHPPVDRIKATAKQFESLCSGDKTTDINPADWEKESHALALNYVYPMNNPDAPALNGILTDTYIANGQKIADVQMCLAGKRLATILNRLLTTPIKG
jgi:hypothetical protein